jgi:hypothetical protein
MQCVTIAVCCSPHTYKLARMLRRSTLKLCCAVQESHMQPSAMHYNRHVLFLRRRYLGNEVAQIIVKLCCAVQASHMQPQSTHRNRRVFLLHRRYRGKEAAQII